MSNEFEEFITSFLRAYAYYNPTEVFRSGWREFAGVLPIYSEGRIKAYIQFLQTNLKRLLNIPIHSLTEVEQLNHLVLQKEIKSQLFDYNDTKEYLTNPLFYTSFYNGPMIVFDYLLKNYAPLEQRVLELSSFLIQIPEYYENALKNLQIEKLAPEHLEITTLMLEGLTSFLANIVQEIQSLENLEQKVCAESYQILQNASIIASNGIKSYLINIRAQLPNAKGSFRMGKELFLKMLVNKECISLSIEDLLNLGEKDLEKNFTEFKSVLNKINPNESPEEIIAEIKKNHPSKDSLLSDTQNMLQKLKTFIAEKEFVSIPSDVMPRVIFTPKPLQSYAFANMDSPGALEQNVTNCYYYITPPDDS